MPPHFKSLYALHKTCHLPAPAHPQLSLFAFDKPTTAFSEYLQSFSGDFYMIALKKIKYGVMLYGRTSYDHQEGTMSFMKPG
ncbi:MAG: AraC family transcriptional regulator, partial [Bacteroidota bacterium]